MFKQFFQFSTMLNISPISPRAGYSLVEVLVAMTIGFVLFAWMSDYMMRALADHTLTLQRNHLNQELLAIFGVMDRDVRRAGFWENAKSSLKKGPVNPFHSAPYRLTTNNKIGEAANSCLTYSYDLNRNGVLDTGTTGTGDERFGFRLNRGVVEMRMGGSGTFDCNSGSWSGLNSSTVIMDSLNFSISGSLCLNMSKSGADCTASPLVSGDVLIRAFQVVVNLNGHLKFPTTIQHSATLTVQVPNMSVESVP
ncbi:MAG: prepilin-type N-terminal cleavage/methylation domain-containing protein [Magnetococcus sp. DMHC-6]